MGSWLQAHSELWRRHGGSDHLFWCALLSAGHACQARWSRPPQHCLWPQVAVQCRASAAAAGSMHLRNTSIMWRRQCAPAQAVLLPNVCICWQVHTGQGRLRARCIRDGREGGARRHLGQLHLAHALLLQQRPRVLGLAARPLARLLWCGSPQAGGLRLASRGRLRCRSDYWLLAGSVNGTAVGFGMALGAVH